MSTSNISINKPSVCSQQCFRKKRHLLISFLQDKHKPKLSHKLDSGVKETNSSPLPIIKPIDYLIIFNRQAILFYSSNLQCHKVQDKLETRVRIKAWKLRRKPRPTKSKLNGHRMWGIEYLY